MTWRAHLALVALLAHACTWGTPPAPRLAGATPSWSLETADVTLVVYGNGFEPAVAVDFDRPAHSRADASFQLELRRAGEPPIPLQDVLRVSTSELRGWLAAGAAPPAVYDLVIVGPGGTASLPAFFEVRAHVCSVEGNNCRDGNPCTVDETCQTGKCAGVPERNGEECSLTCISSASSIEGRCSDGVCVPHAGDCTVP